MDFRNSEHHGFCNAFGIFSPKIKMLSQDLKIKKSNWFLTCHMAVKGFNTLLYNPFCVVVHSKIDILAVG